MKRILLIFLSLPLLFMIGFGILLSIPGEFKNGAFDENTDGIVDVILRDKEDGSLFSRAVGPGQTSRTIDPFESDPLKVYKLAREYDISGFSEENPHMRLLDTWLEDETGNAAEMTPAFQRILEHTAEIDHSVLETYILQQDEHLFAAVELNVNLWLPCVLYYYDAENDELIELITYDAQDYIGLRVRNLENIRS